MLNAYYKCIFEYKICDVNYALSLISIHFICPLQVSDYLKKQMETMKSEAENEENDEVRKAMEDHDKLVEEIFQHEDQDKNGFISHDEFSGPKHDEL